MELSLILIASGSSLHGPQHLRKLEVVNNLLLSHLHDLSLPLQHCEALIHLVLLQFALELRPFLPILKQINDLLCNDGAIAYQLLEFCSLAPAELELGQVVLLHRVSPQEV